MHHKKPLKFCFLGLKCKKCRDLRTFLEVKSRLKILVRVKDLTFCNSEAEWKLFTTVQLNYVCTQLLASRPDMYVCIFRGRELLKIGANISGKSFD